MNFGLREGDVMSSSAPKGILNNVYSASCKGYPDLERIKNVKSVSRLVRSRGMRKLTHFDLPINPMQICSQE